MFSYAARTILSKTLRRILQKYLVDVNIDEVALGGDSGWGVVIKDVELREGAVLFSFPLPQKVNTPKNSSEESKNSDEQSESRKAPSQKNTKKVDFNTKLDSIETIEEVQSKRDVATGKSFEGKKRTHLQVNGERYSIDESSNEDIILEKPPPVSTPQSPFWFYRKTYKEENKDTQRRHSITSETSSSHYTINEDDNQNENQSNDNEEEAVMLQTLEFRVGRGGKIGNLGVRLVGNDLHIFVEDAFLTLEIVTKKETEDQNDKKSKAKSPTNETAEAAEKKSKDNNADTLSTEHKLARTISSLPFISLSNIIIKIVFIDQEDYESIPNAYKNDDESLDPTDYKKLTEKNHLLEIGVGSFTIMDDENDDNDSVNSASSLNGSENMISRMCTSKTTQYTNTNDPDNFVYKRIKIGSEHRKGLWINVYPPFSHPMRQAPQPTDPSWARFIWETVDRPFIHISGFNFLARIFTGLLDKKDEGQENNSSVYGEEYDLFTLDSTIGGYIDYVPITEVEPVVEDTKKTLNMERGQSNFYKIANGMRRHPSPSASPHSDDQSCWVHDGPQSDKGTQQITNMSDFIPAPGIVMFFSICDPLELNIERISLEALKRVLDIANQYKNQNSSKQEMSVASAEDEELGNEKNTQTLGTTKKESNEVDTNSQFPSYMTAENILVIGFQINCIAIRVQMIKDDVMKENGYSFSFCELLAHSISMDSHFLKSEELSFTDCDFDIGYIELNVYKGVNRKQHISIGKNVSVHEKSSLVPARGTAYTLMKSSTILSSSEYLDYRKDAIQFRLIQKKSLYHTFSEPKTSNEIKTFEIQIGSTRIDIGSNFVQEMKSVSNLSNAILFTKQKEPAPPSTPVPLPKHFNWKYFLSLNEGIVKYDNARCEYPSTRLVGEKSPTIGFIIESILNQTELKFSSAYVGCLYGTEFFEKIVDLPENVRMRTFLFLDDLKPLASVLGIENLPENNFLAGYTINKHLRNVIEHLSLRNAKEKLLMEKRKKRRKELLSRIMLLGDDDLEDLVLNLEKKEKLNVY